MISWHPQHTPYCTSSPSWSTWHGNPSHNPTTPTTCSSHQPPYEHRAASDSQTPRPSPHTLLWNPSLDLAHSTCHCWCTETRTACSSRSPSDRTTLCSVAWTECTLPSPESGHAPWSSSRSSSVHCTEIRIRRCCWSRIRIPLCCRGEAENLSSLDAPRLRRLLCWRWWLALRCRWRICGWELREFGSFRCISRRRSYPVESPWLGEARRWSRRRGLPLLRLPGRAIPSWRRSILQVKIGSFGYTGVTGLGKEGVGKREPDRIRSRCVVKRLDDEIFLNKWLSDRNSDSWWLMRELITPVLEPI